MLFARTRTKSWLKKLSPRETERKLRACGFSQSQAKRLISEVKRGN